MVTSSTEEKAFPLGELLLLLAVGPTSLNSLLPSQMRHSVSDVLVAAVATPFPTAQTVTSSHSSVLVSALNFPLLTRHGSHTMFLSATSVVFSARPSPGPQASYSTHRAFELSSLYLPVGQASHFVSPPAVPETKRPRPTAQSECVWSHGSSAVSDHVSPVQPSLSTQVRSESATHTVPTFFVAPQDAAQTEQA